ncbi:cell division protein FtsL [Psittacicella hinzii]|uniref:Uncharacterized protein n=1 Tax=Psittacicella hinzii TaxID=2028575 RepID=A0A3A1YM87_9GAMM|nr:cell division protein FtsL [Psittacicella hinzii]RIY38661.1 hypothetical protein CKF58_03645 [Psittacicella hinzii]
MSLFKSRRKNKKAKISVSKQYLDQAANADLVTDHNQDQNSSQLTNQANTSVDLGANKETNNELNSTQSKASPSLDLNTTKVNTTHQDIADASKANGTMATDFIDDLSQEDRAAKLQLEQEALQKKYMEQAAQRRNKLVEQTYGKLNWHSDFVPLKILYKDFSSKYFFTIILCLIILALSLTKIYLTHKSINTTTSYSKLLADKNSLTLSNDNLRLEFLALTSHASIVRIAHDKISLIPLSPQAEVIVIIPYLPQQQSLTPTQIPILQMPVKK